jgi:hypothetical protein
VLLELCPAGITFLVVLREKTGQAGFGVDGRHEFLSVVLKPDRYFNEMLQWLKII